MARLTNSVFNGLLEAASKGGRGASKAHLETALKQKRLTRAQAKAYALWRKTGAVYKVEAKPRVKAAPGATPEPKARPQRRESRRSRRLRGPRRDRPMTGPVLEGVDKNAQPVTRTIDSTSRRGLSKMDAGMRPTKRGFFGAGVKAGIYDKKILDDLLFRPKKYLLARALHGLIDPFRGTVTRFARTKPVRTADGNVTFVPTDDVIKRVGRIKNSEVRGRRRAYQLGRVVGSSAVVIGAAALSDRLRSQLPQQLQRWDLPIQKRRRRSRWEQDAQMSIQKEQRIASGEVRRPGRPVGARTQWTLGRAIKKITGIEKRKKAQAAALGHARRKQQSRR